MSASTTFRTSLLPCLGLVAAPAVWVLNTQAGQILPDVQCSLPVPVTALLSIAGACLSLGAGALSWWSVRHVHEAEEPKASAFPHSIRFIAGLSGLFGLVFAFALLLQGAASIWLSGCER